MFIEQNLRSVEDATYAQYSFVKKSIKTGFINFSNWHSPILMKSSHATHLDIIVLNKLLCWMHIFIFIFNEKKF